MSITSTDWPAPGPDDAYRPEIDAPPDSELPVKPGDVLAGRYSVDRVLASGGMGVVCLGRHVELEQPVAIKFLRRELSQNQGVVQRFLNEALAAASLRSENVVRVMDVAEHESGRPYLVMEHLDGVDLGALVERDGAIEPARATRYVLDVCVALAEAHAAGIVHRDIKPENLFLCTVSGRDFVKVVDFGLAKRIDAAKAKVVTDPNEGMGSPCYMSPEQIATPHAVDARTDVWSLGVVLYRLVSGTLPFDGDSLSEVCARVLNASPRPLSELVPGSDPALDAIVKRCLAKNRDDRFASIDELAEEIRKYRAAALTDTQPASVPPSAGYAARGTAASPDMAGALPSAVSSSREEPPASARPLPGRGFAGPFVASILAFVAFGAALGGYAAGGVTRLRELTEVVLRGGPLEDERASGLGDHQRPPVDVFDLAPGVYGATMVQRDGAFVLAAVHETKRHRHKKSHDDGSSLDEGAANDPGSMGLASNVGERGEASAEGSKSASDPGSKSGDHAASEPASQGATAAHDEPNLSPDEIERREKRYRRYLDRHGYKPIREVLQQIEGAPATTGDKSPAPAAAQPDPARRQSP